MPLSSAASTWASMSTGEPTDSWLAEFHAGKRAVLEGCYRDHFDVVAQAVGRVLSGADQETVIHEVFYRLLTSEELRRHFTGGALAGWLTTIARNHAIDFRRRRDREVHRDENDAFCEPTTESMERSDARMIIDRFRHEVLPPKWKRVFQLRFIEQLDQRQAAAQIGISRTTLAYQEYRVRTLLRRFVLRKDRK